MRRTTRRVRACAGALALVAAAAGCLTDVGPEVGAGAVPVALNDVGVMAGTVEGEGPVRFEQGGVRVPLEDPVEGQAYVMDLNDAGQVLGYVSVGGSTHPVAWNRAGELIDLRSLVPGADRPGALVQAFDISGKGQVPVNVRGTGTPSLSVVDIERGTVVPVPVEGDADVYPAHINDAGVIVARRSDSTSARWTPRGDGYGFERFSAYLVEDVNEDGNSVGLAYIGDRLVPAILPAGEWRPEPLPTDGIVVERWSLGSGWIGDGDVVVFGTSERTDTGTRYVPVRWRSPAVALERFPLGEQDWWATVLDVNEQGVALAEVFPGPRRMRWTWPS